jgi:hypothetical protein
LDQLNPRVIGGVVPILIVVVLLIARNARPRPLRIERLWIRPVIFLVLMGAALTVTTPPLDPLNIGVLVTALAIGCGLGWLRGSAMKIDVHPETHALTARASPLGLVLIFGLLAVRYVLRGAAYSSAGFLHLSVITIADAFVLLAVGMLGVQGIEMWLRARRLLAEAQAAKAGAQPPPPPPMPKIIS